MWSDEPWWAEESQRRHIHQVRFADLLLGELLDRLRADSLYERSLLIVMSSYGQGFWPSSSRLSSNRTEHPEDVLGVPLFIKRPNQKGAIYPKGITIEAN